MGAGGKESEVLPLRRDGAPSRKESYARRDKADKSLVRPKMLTGPRSKKRSSLQKMVSMLRGGSGDKEGKEGTGKKNPGSLFVGLWLSEDSEEPHGFLHELELSENYAKLAKKYAGSTAQSLRIELHGDEFTVVSNNDRRAVTIKFRNGEPFYSENEKSESVMTYPSVVEESGRAVMQLRSVSESSPQAVVIRRRVKGDTLVEETFMKDLENHESKRTVTRTYHRH
mmetsp:Transcript_8326/g.14735  ORF Transcript_8326/g.14735 Transcript_8326/m.14735 type:complete len:226 (-) Transcript_8326:302-979(-)